MHPWPYTKSPSYQTVPVSKQTLAKGVRRKEICREPLIRRT